LSSADIFDRELNGACHERIVHRSAFLFFQLKEASICGGVEAREMFVGYDSRSPSTALTAGSPLRSLRFAPVGMTR
jgi:hypothetical protein